MFHLLHSDVLFFSFFFFNDTATTEIYTLSLHDALPISPAKGLYASDLARRLHVDWQQIDPVLQALSVLDWVGTVQADRKSTRLNSSHSQISYAVFCLKKKKKKNPTQQMSDRQNRP